MNILVTGQSTLHWGRMEFGNIGNYYIVEPFYRELHKVFPGCHIKTTMQFSEDFCVREGVETLPMELYFDFTSDSNLASARKELRFVEESPCINGRESSATDYIKAVEWADIVIDLSGDIWGDNADFLGKDRFEVGLLKDLIPQKMGKPTFLIAGSPGPFSNPRTKALAKEVFEGFTLVTNREPISTELLQLWGFSLANVKTLACPSFLFQPEKEASARKMLQQLGILADRRPLVGFILCGWNFREGPFDKWPREDKEYDPFVEAIEYICGSLGAKVCLMSHSNGFPIPPETFCLQHGRDYPVIKQLEKILKDRNEKIPVYALDGVYEPQMTKAIIGQFDLLVSGRIHGATAGFSQCIPTVVIDYGHEPKAHKLLGFATVAGQQEFVANPASQRDLISKIQKCWENIDTVKKSLENRIPEVKKEAEDNFLFIRKALERQ